MAWAVGDGARVVCGREVPMIPATWGSGGWEPAPPQQPRADFFAGYEKSSEGGPGHPGLGLARGQVGASVIPF